MTREAGRSRGVAVLGSTGSIGTTALRVIARQRDRFHVAALTAFANAALLASQEAATKPSYVGLVSPNGEKPPASWHIGAAALVEAATRDDVDIVLNAVVGAAGTRRDARRARGGEARGAREQGDARDGG